MDKRAQQYKDWLGKNFDISVQISDNSLPGRLKLFRVARNIPGPLVQAFLHAIRLTPRILKCLVHFWESYAPLIYIENIIP